MTRRCRIRYPLCVLFGFALISGCDERSAPSQPTPAAKTAILTHVPIATALPKWKSEDQAKGFFHEASGIGIVLPEGWQVAGKSENGDVTSLGLDKDGGASTVTLYWTKLGPEITPGSIGEHELAGLNQLYPGKVNGPMTVTVNGQTWLKFRIAAGPIGNRDPRLSGVVYLIEHRRGQENWKIKLRATVDSPRRLDEVEALLNQYRVQP